MTRREEPPTAPSSTSGSSESDASAGSGDSAGSSLAQKILRETTRFAAVQALASVLAWATNILLARVLERRDFGVYGVCAFWVGIGALLGDGGLGATLMRRKRGVSVMAYRVTVTFLLGVAAVMGTALYFAAPWIGRRYHFEPAEIRVLRAMAPLYLVSSLRVVPYIRMERALEFSRIARVELTASIVRHLLAITIAFLHGGVWALVVSNVVGSVLQLVLAYRASPGWVGIGWSWRTFRPLISYGGQVQTLGILAFLKDNVSPALLGLAIGPAAVGVFDFGLKYIQVPVTAVNALARVQLPVYARLSPHDPTLFAALRGATRAALLLGIPVLLLFAFGAPWVVPWLFAPRWSASIPVVWGLLANMVGGLVASPLFTLLQGQGRAGLAIAVFVGWTLATWALAIASIVVFPGMLGPVAGAHSIVTVIVVIGLVRWAGRHLRHKLFQSLASPLVAGAISFGAGLAAGRYAPIAMRHPVGLAAGTVVVYAAALFAIDGRNVIDEVRAVLKTSKSS